METQPKQDTFRFHRFERPIERLPFNPGYSEERRCTICGQDEYSCGPQGAECPGPPPQKAAMQTQPSELIERVARALTDEFSFDPAAAQLIARVAIAAMREPTEAMISIGDGVEFRGEIWREMIDEALKGA